MKKILLKILEGKTIGDIAKELNMGEHTIRAIIDSMIHAGYIMVVQCGNGCNMCPMKCDPLPSTIKMYMLTEKGMEYLRQRQE